MQAGLGIEFPRAGLPTDHVHVVINDTFSLSTVPCRFDFVIANSLFAYLPFNRIAMCIAGVLRPLAPSGRFYATWFENPDETNFQPIVRPGGGFTYPDRQPYHYPFELIVQACAAAGRRWSAWASRVSARRIGDSHYPPVRRLVFEFDTYNRQREAHCGLESAATSDRGPGPPWAQRHPHTWPCAQRLSSQAARPSTSITPAVSSPPSI